MVFPKRRCCKSSINS